MQYSKDIQTNSFSGGMNMDVDVNFIKSNIYRYAENVRIITDSSGTSGVLQNSDGIEYKYKMEFENLGERIIHVDSIRNYCVVFTVDYFEINRIYRINFSLDYSDTSFFKKILESNLGIVTPVSSVMRHESSDSIKIYWSDYSESNTIRVANILPEYAFDDANYYIGVDEGYVNITPTFPMSSLEFYGNGTGNLLCGAYQYAYQLYNNYNSASMISPLTDIIYIGNGSPSDSISDIKGASSSVSSGKSIILHFNFDDEIDLKLYSYIRIYRIYYKSYTSTPIINNIGEYPISESSLKIEDNGSFAIDEKTTE